MNHLSFSQSALQPGELFEGIEPKGIVLAAVSGGSDSIALLLLANAWSAPRDIALHAITVDHGLRPEAAAEAAFVASLCEALGIDHTTIGWEGIKPHSGVADSARRARYTLMEEFALEIGADIILTGHTANDQAETVFMRLTRHNKSLGQASGGSGRGLSGMARRGLLPGGCELVRPLLGATRSRLRDYLSSFPQNWVEDPTNHDLTYERVRVRRMLEGDPVLEDRLTRFGSVMGGMRSVLSRDTAKLLSATVTLQSGPVFILKHEIALSAPRPVAILAIQMLLAVAGGSEQMASGAGIERLLEMLDDPDFSRMTLGGVVVERASHGLRFYREMRDLPTVKLEAGETLLWDGRMEINNASGAALWVGPLTGNGLAEIEAKRGNRFSVRPRAALLSSPLVRMQSGENWLPMVENSGDAKQVFTRLTARSIEHFCPESDYPLLDWLSTLDIARNACLQPRI